jgi:Arc/MetJ-type ribon-helix-helix transcriptional regulator
MAVQLLVELSANEIDDLKRLIERRGYDNPSAYIRELINRDAQAHGETPLFDIDDSDEYIAQSFKEGMIQALRGETRPWREAFAELRAKDE